MLDVLAYPRAVAGAWLEAAAALSGQTAERPALMPTPRDPIVRLGGATLVRFRRPATAPASGRLPLLLVPSLINRWYVMDLRRGASLVEALTADGIDTFCLDWGAPADEDRYLDWDQVLERLARAARTVLRVTGAPRLGLLGYCLGGTLTAIHAALQPGQVAALVDLAGPIDFSRGGMLRDMVDRRWFDADAIADAGNVSAAQMQSGFVALRPTLELAKRVAEPDLALDAEARLAARALEAWASDNIGFPGEAYRTYITDLYQGNALVEGRHVARGRRVSLAEIRCPTLVITADRDHICPPPAARALLDHVGAGDTAVVAVPGGHVGAVVGRAASRAMYPATVAWLRERLAR